MESNRWQQARSSVTECASGRIRFRYWEFYRCTPQGLRASSRNSKALGLFAAFARAERAAILAALERR